jgi:ABC-2 type transport system permease protein
MADRRNFRKFLAVFRREFLERVRTRLFVATTLLGPLFFAAITIGPAWLALRERGSETIADVTILDATGSQLGCASSARSPTPPPAACARC